MNMIGIYCLCIYSGNQTYRLVISTAWKCLQVSRKLDAPYYYPGKNTRSTHWTGGCVGCKIGLGCVGKRGNPPGSPATTT